MLNFFPSTMNDENFFSVDLKIYDVSYVNKCILFLKFTFVKLNCPVVN